MFNDSFHAKTSIWEHQKLHLILQEKIMEELEIKQLIAALRSTQSNEYSNLCKPFMRNILAQRIEDDMRFYIDNPTYSDVEDIFAELSNEFNINR